MPLKSNCMCKIFLFLDLLLIFRISYKFILLTYNSLPFPSITTLCAPLKINIIKLLASVGWNYCWCWTVFCRLAMICFSCCLGFINVYHGIFWYTWCYLGGFLRIINLRPLYWTSRPGLCYIVGCLALESVAASGNWLPE